MRRLGWIAPLLALLVLAVWRGRADEGAQAALEPDTKGASSPAAPEQPGLSSAAGAGDGPAVDDARVAVDEANPGPGLVVRGTVRGAGGDGGAGRPLEGAELHLRFGDGRRAEELGRTRSDADGRFAFAALAPARTAGWDAAATLTVTASAAGFREAAVVLRDVRDGPRAREAELALVASPRVSGVVVDALGRPVAGARVELVWPVRRGGEAALAAAGAQASEADGTFALPLEPAPRNRDPRRRAVLCARHERAGVAAVLLAALARDEGVAGLRVALGAPRAVAGTVTDGAGRPLPGYPVAALRAGLVELPDALGDARALTETARAPLVVHAEADASGAFALEGLAAGDYVLYARPPGARPEAFDEGAPHAAGARGLRLVARERLTNVRVLWPDGAPCADASVLPMRRGVGLPLAAPWSARTDGAGSARLLAAPGRTLCAAGYDPGRGSGRAEVELGPIAGEAEVWVRLVVRTPGAPRAAGDGEDEDER